MNKRNAIWLGVIVVVGVAGVLVFSLVWGLVAAGVTLVVSEIVERTARKRRRAQSGSAPGRKVSDIITLRRRSR